MKYIKSTFLLMAGAGIGILFKTYEEEITCACKKMMKMEKELIENGLDIN